MRGKIRRYKKGAEETRAGRKERQDGITNECRKEGESAGAVEAAKGEDGGGKKRLVIDTQPGSGEK